MADTERAPTLYGRDSVFTSLLMGKYSAYSPYRLMRREIGLPVPVGAGDAMARSLYCGMKPIAVWDPDSVNALPTGGVFNLEFSPEGNILVAACEKKSIQLFDPATHLGIHSVNGAHSDCVNCVKFLDNRMFATCSDDTTIALWDVRNLNKKIRTLTGHSNWVKNIEFSVKDKLLVTSGLDGSIYTWDINSDVENATGYQRVFHASGLMRCRLSPDGRQMVMCTTGGLLVIIHDLNLATLAADLHGFKPNLYRLMQMSQQLIPIAATYDHLFDRKRKENRVEFVSDFPTGNDAEVVSALQIHPQGWTALSRNISHDDRSEWTCIHDIQPRGESEPVPRPHRPRRARLRASRRRSRQLLQSGARSGLTAEQSAAAPPTAPPVVAPIPAPGVPCIQNDVWEASITVRQRRLLLAMASRGQVGRNFNMQRIMGINTGISPPEPSVRRRVRNQPETRTARNDSRVWPSLLGHAPRTAEVAVEAEPGYLIRQNADRLLYYAEETNEGKGFIKELCYSADGRLICSPFGRGMRLLALNEYCSELSHCLDETDGPRALVEVGQCLGFHRDLVVSTKFSPRYRQLVTGCLEGKIVWYEPFSGELL